jgi:hypothetical protein
MQRQCGDLQLSIEKKGRHSYKPSKDVSTDLQRSKPDRSPKILAQLTFLDFSRERSKQAGSNFDSKFRSNINPSPTVPSYRGRYMYFSTLLTNLLVLLETVAGLNIIRKCH